ncbi:MAG: polysaccharide deacetylase family protein [Candidatus Firestonebacteria bacterium]
MPRFLSRFIKNLLNWFSILNICRIICNKKELVPILIYHRIGEDFNTKTDKSSFYLKKLLVSKKRFEKQIKYLTGKYNVISLTEYLNKKLRGENLSGYAVVTFDDGFKDFLTIGLEILNKYNCPATVFIIGDATETIYWKHKLYSILDCAEIKFINFKVTPELNIDISLVNAQKKQQTLNALLEIIEQYPDTQKENIIERIKKVLNVSKEIKPDELYLTKNDLAILYKENIINIGAHSMSHNNLTNLNTSNITKEINDSVDVIKKLTKNDMLLYSSPFGGYNEKIIEILKEKNFVCNLTGDFGLNKKDEDNYRLKRIFITEESLSEFVYKVSGFEMFYRNLFY